MTRYLTIAALTLVTALAAAADEPKPPADLKAHQAFAERVEKAIRDNDARAFRDFLDGDAFAARVLKDLAVPVTFKTKLEGMTDTFGARFLGELARKTSGTGQGVKLLRVRVVDGEPRALFHSVTEDGMNYLDFVLSTPPAGGPVKIVDAYVALTGEFLSRTMAPILAKGIATVRDNPGDLGAVKEATRKLEQMSRFTSLVRAGKTAEALAAYDKLPAEYRKEKVVMLMHVIVTSNRFEEDPASYEKSIDAFVKAFPSDPAVDLVSLDGFLLKKKYAEFHKALDRLDKSVGGDPYLHVLRGNALQMEGKSAEAKKAIGKAIAWEPDLTAAYLARADVALAQKDHKELARLLALMESRFEIDFAGVATADDYAEFRRSPEYREWWANRKKK